MRRLWLLLLLVVAGCSEADATFITRGSGGGAPPVEWAYVSSAVGSNDASSGSIGTGSLSVTAHNGIVVCVGSYNGTARTVSSVQDGDSTALTYAGRYQNVPYVGIDIEIWYLADVPTTKSTTYTATLSGTATYRRIVALQFSGIDNATFIDSSYTPAGNSDSSSPYTTTADSTSGNDEFVVGCYYNYSSGTYSSSSPSVYRADAGSGDFATATNDAPSIGSYSVSVACSVNQAHGCFARAFKQAAP